MTTTARIDITAERLELAMQVNEYPSTWEAVQRWINLFFVHPSSLQIKDVRIVSERSKAE